MLVFIAPRSSVHTANHSPWREQKANPIKPSDDGVCNWRDHMARRAESTALANQTLRRGLQQGLSLALPGC